MPTNRLMVMTMSVSLMTSFLVGQTTFCISSYVWRRNVTGVVIGQLKNIPLEGLSTIVTYNLSLAKKEEKRIEKFISVALGYYSLPLTSP